MLSKVLLVCSAVLPFVFTSVLETAATYPREIFSHPKDVNSSGLSPRIIGGEEVTTHAYPFQAALLIYDGKTEYFCGGSLISNQWVLTAAHCLSMHPDYITVVLGVYNFATANAASMVIVNSTKYVYHKKYKDDIYLYDVGLVKLPRNVTFSSAIQPVQLATGNASFAGETGTILGFGETETVSISTVLRVVNSTVMTNAECAAANVAFAEVLDPTHVCTSGRGTVGSCSGDSGGPLLIDGVQAGVVSFGTTNCMLGMPSVFTRVTDYHDWIIENAVDGAGSLDAARFVAVALAALILMLK